MLRRAFESVTRFMHVFLLLFLDPTLSLDTHGSIDSLGSAVLPASTSSAAAASAPTERIALAAGCFWSPQRQFDQLRGVKSTVVGYTGGKTVEPTYEDVCSGETGHAEAVDVEFDPAVVPLRRVLDLFFDIHDATQVDRQGWDVGTQYRSAIFVRNEEQRKEALEAVAREHERLGKPVATKVEDFTKFYDAEEYHQYFLDKREGRR